MSLVLFSFIYKQIQNKQKKAFERYQVKFLRIYGIHPSKDNLLKETDTKKINEILFVSGIILAIFKTLMLSTLKIAFRGYGYIELFSELSKIEDKAINISSSMSQGDKELFCRRMDLEINKMPTYLNLIDNNNINSESRLEKFISKYNLTSKTKIAKEFGIDKTTLNKWLNYYWGSKFDNVRKINVSDYISIMLKFTLKESEKKSFIGKNLKIYASRLNNDLVHNRSTLLEHPELEGSNVKDLKENLKLQNLDSSMKKIPYSIKEIILAKLT